MKRIIFLFSFLGTIFLPSFVYASYHFSNFRGKPPIHIYGKASKIPIGITPSQIKKIYNLPENGGHGTIAIIGAYNDNSIEKDLSDFNKQFNLSECTTRNKCLEKQQAIAVETACKKAENYAFYQLINNTGGGKPEWAQTLIKELQDQYPDYRYELRIMPGVYTTYREYGCDRGYY